MVCWHCVRAAGWPCEASPATRIFGFSQPPALVESPPSPSLPRSAQARLSSTTTLSVACRILKKHKQRTVPLPSTRAPPPESRVPPIIVSFFALSLPAKPPKHTLFLTTSLKARYHYARLVHATTATPITPANSHRSPCNHVGRKQLARAPAQVGPRRAGTDRGPQGVGAFSPPKNVIMRLFSSSCSFCIFCASLVVHIPLCALCQAASNVVTASCGNPLGAVPPRARGPPPLPTTKHCDAYHPKSNLSKLTRLPRAPQLRRPAKERARAASGRVHRRPLDAVPVRPQVLVLLQQPRQDRRLARQAGSPRAQGVPATDHQGPRGAHHRRVSPANPSRHAHNASPPARRGKQGTSLANFPPAAKMNRRRRRAP